MLGIYHPAWSLTFPSQAGTFSCSVSVGDRFNKIWRKSDLKKKKKKTAVNMFIVYHEIGSWAL